MLERLQGEAPDLTSPERQSEGPASSGAYRSILCFLGPWSMPRPVNRNFVLEAQLKECKTSGALIPPATPSAKRRMIRLEARSSPPGFFFWNIERIRKLAGQLGEESTSGCPVFRSGRGSCATRFSSTNLCLWRRTCVR
jgi:hypothetical protein